jgi:acetylornithine deacetylase/succinyl-diaminopimelate desuccinylase-like protein
MRTVPNMDGAKAAALLKKKLTTNVPYGAKVTVTASRGNVTPWWTTDPEGPAFEAARRALKAGYGRECAMIGTGGSIGFVQPFSDALGGAPCLLIGVEDPLTNAHSEDESLHLGDWVKCMRSAIHLYDELSRTPVVKK